MSKFILENLSAEMAQQYLPQLADLLHVNVANGASVSFIEPFTLNDAQNFWQDEILPSLVKQRRILLVAMQDNQLTGCVMLDFDMPPNQPHRGEIAKLLVHPKFRRQGIARALMLQIDQMAFDQELSLLVLDTANDGAEKLYADLGYIRVGVIPNFALNSTAKSHEATTIMYKQLK